MTKSSNVETCTLEPKMKEVLAKGLIESARDSMRMYGRLNCHVALFQLTRCANKPCKLNGTQASTSSASKNERQKIGRKGSRRDTAASSMTPSQTERPKTDGSASDRSTEVANKGTAAVLRSLPVKKTFDGKMPLPKDHSALSEKRQVKLDRHGRDIFKESRRRYKMGQMQQTGQEK